MHSLEHAFFDSLKIIPFIFLIYLVIEYFEHKNNTFFSHKLMKSKKMGVIYGSLLGSIPQCGFSVIASDLYSKKTITMGTLVAIFVATSDEAVPIILASTEKMHFVIGVIAVKIVIAIVFGIAVDLIFKSTKNTNTCEIHHHHEHFHGNCENCEDGILKSTLKHTVRIFIFVFIANLIITFGIETIGKEKLVVFLGEYSYYQPFIAALLGLIPNCASSVILTQCFVNGAISFGALIAGLCSGAGVGTLLLFKKNKNIRENFTIIGILYIIGVLSGTVIQFCGF